MSTRKAIDGRDLAVRAAVRYQTELGALSVQLDVMVARLAHKLERARTLGLTDMAAQATERVTALQQAVKAIERERGESEVFVEHIMRGPEVGNRRN